MDTRKATKGKLTPATATAFPIATSLCAVARCFDDENGKEFSEAYFNGYAFGDRALEGVYFKATLDAQQRLSVQCVEPKNNSYLKGLNMDFWTAEALEFAIGNDVFSEKPDGTGDELCYVVSDQ